MPTREVTPTFLNEYTRLTKAQQEQFRAAVRALVADLKAGKKPRDGLRVKSVKGAAGVFELTWEYHNGRATFSYGPTQPGTQGPHIIWRRIGGHDIFKQP